MKALLQPGQEHGTWSNGLHEAAHSPPSRAHGTWSSGLHARETEGPHRGGTRLRYSQCSGCRGYLGDKVVTAMGQRFHPGCFKCAHCHKALTGSSFLKRDGKAYHEGCFDEVHGIKCRGCKRCIEDKYLMGPSGETYHPACFCCVECGVSCEHGFDMIQGKLFCTKHIRRAKDRLSSSEHTSAATAPHSPTPRATGDDASSPGRRGQSPTNSDRSRSPTAPAHQQRHGGHYHDPSSTSIERGNHLGDRPSTRQSDMYKQHTAGDAVKRLLGGGEPVRSVDAARPQSPVESATADASWPRPKSPVEKVAESLAESQPPKESRAVRKLQAVLDFAADGHPQPPTSRSPFSSSHSSSRGGSRPSSADRGLEVLGEAQRMLDSGGAASISDAMQKALALREQRVSDSPPTSPATSGGAGDMSKPLSGHEPVAELVNTLSSVAKEPDPEAVAFQSSPVATTLSREAPSPATSALENRSASPADISTHVAKPHSPVRENNVTAAAAQGALHEARKKVELKLKTAAAAALEATKAKERAAKAARAAEAALKAAAAAEKEVAAAEEEMGALELEMRKAEEEAQSEAAFADSNTANLDAADKHRIGNEATQEATPVNDSSMEAPDTRRPGTPGVRSVAERLQELAALRDADLVSVTEFAARREAILDQL